MKKNINYRRKKIIFLLFFLFLYGLFGKYIKSNSNKCSFIKKDLNKKRVGVVSLPYGRNVGNLMVKFTMFKKLEELGFNATLISPKDKFDGFETDSSFFDKIMTCHIFYVNNNFSEIKESDFDYLMVNSDQTWNFYNYKYFYNVALLKFAENWKVKKFIYGTSWGKYEWYYNKSDENLFKNLLKNFTGLSFREKGSLKLIEDNLGLKSFFVLDPTLLFDKQYYLEQIKYFKSSFYSNEKFIFVYQLDENPILTKTLLNACEKFNLKINYLELNNRNYVENFIYGINNCQAVITDSFHGTVFSIIFDKPFLSFSNSKRGIARFDSLKEVFDLKNRLVEFSNNSIININLLREPLNINKTLLVQLKIMSIKYLKKNLDIG